MQKLRIVVADDHDLIRQVLISLLNAQPDMQVVGTALRGEDACRLVNKLKPDIVVMDFNMPGLGGAAATKRIKDLHPLTKVVILSGYEDDIYVRLAFKNGASAYLVKSLEVQQLVQALRVVSKGVIYIPPKLSKNLNETTIEGSDIALSEREKETIRLAASGLSNKEIASLLGVSNKTIETYKTRINKKMGFHSRADLVRYAALHGLLKVIDGA